MTAGAAIYGAGGHARVVSSILRARGISVIGFFDDSFQGKEIIQGAPVLGRFNDIFKYKDSFCAAYLAIGDNSQRKKAYNILVKNKIVVPPLVHPKSVMEIDAKVKPGTVICMGAIVGTEVKIGKGVILNTGCSADHEVQIGDFVHIAPKSAIAGRTRIGKNTFIGMNASIADNLKIGKNVQIGAGSIVLRDVPDGEKVRGVYH